MAVKMTFSSFTHCVCLIMITTLVTLRITSLAAGAPQAICPNQAIEVLEGETVDLPCYLDPPDNVVNYAVDWKRLDLNKVVYSFRHKQENHQAQMDQYRGRATLNHEDLSRGILTLQISSVQLSDSGPYRCFVSKLLASCKTTLSIVKRDQLNGTKRNDSSTARPPVDEVTVAGDRDAPETIRNIVIASLCGGVAAIAAIAAGVIFILVKLGKLQACKGTHRRINGQEEEMMPDNQEMENLT